MDLLLNKKIRLLILLLILIPVSCGKRILRDEGIIDHSLRISQLEKQYQSKNWTVRRDAVNRAYEYPSREALEFFIKASYDIHNLVKIDALFGLALYDSDRAYNRIKDVAVDNAESDIVHIAALKALNNYKSPRAVYIFINSFYSGDSSVRKAAIAGLLNINNDAVESMSIPYIIKALNDSSVSVRMTTLDNIRIKDPKIYDYLKKYIMNKKNHNNNTYLVKVLETLEGYEIDEDLEKVLIGLLTHYNLEVRVLSLRALKAQPSLQ